LRDSRTGLTGPTGRELQIAHQLQPGGHHPHASAVRKVAGRGAPEPPIGDAIIVLRTNGPKATACGVHGATTLVVLLAAAT
jgi:hypothetical protein